MSLKIVYIAGPYRARSGAHDASVYNEIEDNIRRAEAVAIRLWQAGFGVFCPHLNTAHFEIKAPDTPPEAYLEADLRLLEACDILYLLPGWEHSKGAVYEKLRATELGLPIYKDLTELVLAEGE